MRMGVPDLTFAVFLARRLGMAAATVAFATALTFILINLAPGDPAEIVLSRVFIGDPETAGTRGDLAIVASRFGFDNPLVIQYAEWARRAIRLDFGTSIASGMPVAGEVAERIGSTVVLAFASTALALAITAVLVSAGRLFPGAGVRVGVDAASVASVSIPNFYLGLVLVLAFSLGLDLLPVSGAGSWRHYVLPTAVLALGQFGYFTTLLNASLRDAAGQLYVLTARAKGLPARDVFRRHVLRNAIVPVVPYVALQLGFLFGGVVVIERLFSLPGLGGYLVDSLDVRDVPAFLATIALVAAFVSVANLTGDILLFALDPRVRFAQGRQWR